MKKYRVFLLFGENVPKSIEFSWFFDFLAGHRCPSDRVAAYTVLEAKKNIEKLRVSDVFFCPAGFKPGEAWAGHSKSVCFVYTGSDFLQKCVFRVDGKLCFEVETPARPRAGRGHATE